MVNESQIIADINASSVLLSKRTCVAQHPYVTDVELELKQIEEEQTADMEQYGNAFVQKPVEEDEAIKEDGE